MALVELPTTPTASESEISPDVQQSSNVPEERWSKPLLPPFETLSSTRALQAEGSAEAINAEKKHVGFVALKDVAGLQRAPSTLSRSGTLQSLHSQARGSAAENNNFKNYAHHRSDRRSVRPHTREGLLSILC